MAADPSRLLARLDEFTAFARKRLGDADLAAEAVQESFLKALGHADQLDDEERVVAWFYRILRNVIVDLQRRGLYRISREFSPFCQLSHDLVHDRRKDLHRPPSPSAPLVHQSH